MPVSAKSGIPEVDSLVFMKGPICEITPGEKQHKRRPPLANPDAGIMTYQEDGTVHYSLCHYLGQTSHLTSSPFHSWIQGLKGPALAREQYQRTRRSSCFFVGRRLPASSGSLPKDAKVRGIGVEGVGKNGKHYCSERSRSVHRCYAEALGKLDMSHFTAPQPMTLLPR